jgi:hypothetical protein
MAHSDIILIERRQQLFNGDSWRVKMSTQRDRADQEVVGNQNTQPVAGINHPLTPLQSYYLSLLQRLVATKNSYQTDPSFEPWLMNAVKKSIYSTLRDCIEANIGDAAKELLRREHQVN